MGGYEDHGLRTGQLVNANYIPHFLEIADTFEDDVVPLLDQRGVRLGGLTADQIQWRQHGYVIKKTSWTTV